MAEKHNTHKCTPENFSYDSPLTKIKIVSNNICYGPEPYADDEIEQHLTITASGNVRLLRYAYGDPSQDKHPQTEKQSFKIMSKDAATIMTAVSAYFGERYCPCMVTDCGEWDLSLTNEKGETCRLEGSLGCQPDNDSTLAELSGMIRKTLGLNDLFVFDGNYNEESDEMTYTDRYNEITSTFLNHLATEQKGQNVIFSPASIITLLAMTAQATAGSTRDEIVNALGAGMTYEEITESISSLLQTLNGRDGYHSSSAIVTKKVIGSKINTKCAQVMHDTYGADLIKSDDIVTDVNAWVNNKTNGMIPTIADDSMKDMLALLINAVAYEGTWQDPFEDYAIREGAFTNADNSRASVPMMSGREDQYVEDRYYRGFIKYYRNGYCYMALLPRKTGQTNLYHALQYTDFTALYNSRRPASVDIRMPEYRYDFAGDLMHLCERMGIRQMFTDTADFSPLASTQLVVNGIFQKAHIEVDRNGTKAAAASMVVMCGCLPTFEQKRVYLNRPFVYAIIHGESGVPVFAGVVNQLDDN